MRRRTIARAGLTAALSVGVLMGMATLTPAVAATGGSGPYPADWSTASSLPNHTIYRPNSLPSQRLPIVAWSNGACSADGTGAANFLREIASHGFLVISNGNPGAGGSSNSSWLTQSIDWAVAENSRPQSALYNRLDTSKIGVAGFSCGGLEAYAVSGDPRVTTTGIFSSGLLNDANDYQLKRLDHPIAYIVGGPSDIAYPNAINDLGELPSGLPAFMGNLNVGHGGTYWQANGGEFGRAAQLWFRWQLKGDTTAGRAFVGSNCGLCGTAWTVKQKNLTLGSDPTPTPTPTSNGSIEHKRLVRAGQPEQRQGARRVQPVHRRRCPDQAVVAQQRQPAAVAVHQRRQRLLQGEVAALGQGPRRDRQVHRRRRPSSSSGPTTAAPTSSSASMFNTRVVTSTTWDEFTYFAGGHGDIVSMSHPGDAGARAGDGDQDGDLRQVQLPARRR